MRHVGRHGEDEDGGGGGEAEDAGVEEGRVGGGEEGRGGVARVEEGHRQQLQKKHNGWMFGSPLYFPAAVADHMIENDVVSRRDCFLPFSSRRKTNSHEG